MALSKEEKEQLERLNKKAKEPDGPPSGVNFSLNLDSDKAWERAKSLGLIPGGDDESKDDDGEGEDREDDDTPKRRSYFGE